MKCPLFTIASIGALALTSTLAQAQTAVTGALGYYTQELPAGGSLVSIGLVSKSDFSGAMSGMTAGSPSSTIHQTGASWTPGAFSNHYVEIREGQWEGLVLDIVSNGTDSVVVNGDIGPSGFNLSGTAKYLVRAHATLDTIFPGGAGLSTGLADFVTIFDSNGGQKNFANNGGSWIEFPFFVSAGTEKIYPGQGILITASGARTITIGGNEISTVKNSKTLVPVYSGVVNLVGLINPLVATGATDPIYPSETTLGEMGFADTPTPFAPVADFVQLFASGGLTSLGAYTYDGTKMVDFPAFTDASAVKVTVGNAFSIAPSADKYYSQPNLLP